MNRLDPAGRVGWAPHAPDGGGAEVAAAPLGGVDDDAFAGLTALLGALRQSGRGLALWVLACIAVAGAYLMHTPPEFVATTQIVLEPRRPAIGETDASAATGPTLDSAQADSQMQVLKSERTLRFVFDTLALADDPTYAAPAPGLAGHLLALVVGPSAGLSAEDQAALDKAQAFQAFSDRVTVRRIGQSYVLELSFRAPSAGESARLANAITAAYIRDQVEFRAATAVRGTEFLQGRITDIKAEKEIAVEAVRTGIIPDYQFADSDARVVSAAQKPLGKAYPQSSLILLLATTFGLLGGTASIAIRRKLDRTIRTRQHMLRMQGVEGVTMLPRLPETGGHRSGGGDEAFTSVLNEPGSAFAEALRVLRTTILAARPSPRPMAIGIVSWSPGEGRSTLASNLAFVVGASRERVALIDADFRNPALSRALAPQAVIGLDEVLLSHATRTHPLAIALNRVIDLLPAVAWGGTGNPDVFIGSAEMQHLLASLQQERDVIIDLPPLSLSADAQAIGPLLDGVILLAEADRTTIDEVEEAIRALRAARTRLLGVVLNKVVFPKAIPRRGLRPRFRPAWSLRR